MNAQQLDDNIPISQRPSRILTEDLGGRLHLINEARRKLALAGCRVVAQRINQGTRERAVLVLDAATPSLTQSLMPQLLQRDGATVYVARLGQVLVEWTRVEGMQ